MKLEEKKNHKVEITLSLVVYAMVLGMLVLIVAAMFALPSTALAITPADAWSADLPWPGGPIFHDAADCSWWHFFQGYHWYDPTGITWDMYWWLR